MRKNWILLELQFSGSATKTLWTPASSSTMATRLLFPGHRLVCDYVNDLYNNF